MLMNGRRLELGQREPLTSKVAVCQSNAWPPYVGKPASFCIPGFCDLNAPVVAAGDFDRLIRLAQTALYRGPPPGVQ